MSTSVNAGSRLDRLPIGPFHRRIMFLIGIGMFFDGFDIYLAGTVLGVTLKTGFSTLPQNAMFISATAMGDGSPTNSTCWCSASPRWPPPSRQTWRC
jgi:MFS transporter, putative metabolite:H+ symporter